MTSTPGLNESSALQVSTACFAYLTLQLRQLAAGKVVLALEGGFNLSVLCTAVEQVSLAIKPGANHTTISYNANVVKNLQRNE
jgi:acetoin utilization deacetylase AcuC-like enzyme